MQLGKLLLLPVLVCHQCIGRDDVAHCRLRLRACGLTGRTISALQRHRCP